jgi:predicted O-methyltransferase YrrM
MTDWAQGYIADVPYPAWFFREVGPNYLAFMVAGLGKEPGQLRQPRRILELGSGMGLTVTGLAAANPDVEFEGVDFNPQHVMHGHSLAAKAGLANVQIRESSFADLAAERGEQNVDLMILHGILTWVGSADHDAIVEIARRRLRPGGFLYASYNCMPGWAPTQPLQRLIREHAKRHPDRSDDQLAAAMEFIKALQEEGALYFVRNPQVVGKMEQSQKLDRNYLAHEYLNANWYIFHFADVAELFAQAKLTYVGSASLLDNLDVVSTPEKLQPRIVAIKDPIWRETLRDYVSNKGFRRDVYARGLTTMGGIEQRELLGRMRFVLAVPRSAANYKFQSLLGPAEGKDAVNNPIMDLLSEKIASFSEIAALPSLHSTGEGGALQAIIGLVASGQIVPICCEAEVGPAPAHRFNRMVVDEIQFGRTYPVLVSPVARTCIPAQIGDLVALAAYFDGHADTPARAAQYGYTLLGKVGIRPMKDGKPIEDVGESLAELERNFDVVLSEKFPIWRRLGVI